MFNDKFCLTQAVLEGRKTMTRRIVTDRLLKDCVVTGEVLIKSHYKVGEVVAVAQSYHDSGFPSICVSSLVRRTRLDEQDVRKTPPHAAPNPHHRHRC